MGAKKLTKSKIESIELTDNEVRDITEALVNREPLDDKSCFLLFKKIGSRLFKRVISKHF